MSSKEIKAALKAAREAINAKDFVAVLKHCKDVLKIDKTNYMALVFIGKATAELGQADQAFAAYKKATAASPDQPLAWQGMADFCSKSGKPEHEQELTASYEKLVSLFEGKDWGKWCETMSKLAELWQAKGQLPQAVACWQRIVDRTDSLPEDLCVKRLITGSEKVFDLIRYKIPEDEEYLSQLEQAHDVLVAQHPDTLQQQRTSQAFIEYLQALWQLTVVSDVTAAADHFDKVCSLCHAMTKRWPEFVFPLKVLCLLSLQEHVDDHDPLPTDVLELYDGLELADSDHPLVSVCRAHRLLCQRQLIPALELLQAVDSLSSCPVYWCLLSLNQLRVHDRFAAENSAQKGLRTLAAGGADAFGNLAGLRHKLQVCLVRSYLRENDFSHRAVSLCQELLQEHGVDHDVQLFLAEAQLLSGRNREASEICERLLRANREDHAALSLLGAIELADQHWVEAETDLRQAVELCDNIAIYHFRLGCALWKNSQQHQSRETLQCFLQAARLDPFHAQTFFFIGQYYHEVVKDWTNAQRCFEKAVELDSDNCDAATALGGCLLSRGDQAGALAVYENIVSSVSAKRAHWAWLRMGLLQIQNGQPGDAVKSFKVALRARPSDGRCWECLAEAYMARGAYDSSRRAFKRALELSPSIYCRYKLAAIHYILGSLPEAVMEYRTVLEARSDYVPALKGLAETHLQQAIEALEQNFDLSAVDYVNQALDILARAVQLRPHFACLWKLIGDTCCALHQLPKEVIKVSMPSNLQIKQEESSSVMDKARLLAVGGRAYSQALKLTNTSSHSLWHDLGVNLLYQMQLQDTNKEMQQTLAQQSLQALQKAIQLCKTDHSHWTALGVLCCHPAINNPALAQHSFIKSIQLESDNAVAWANLGALYIHHGNIQLAYEALKKAQDTNPDYVCGWLGLTMVAESTGEQLTADLYRQCSEMTYHPQAAIGYAQYICSQVVQENQRLCEGGDATPVSTTELHVSDRLDQYTRRYPQDLPGLSMFAMLLEKQRLLHEAEKAYKSACEVAVSSLPTDSPSVRLVQCGHARVLRALGRCKEAQECYASVSEMRFEDLCDNALATFGDPTSLASGDCLQNYDKTHSQCTDERNKSAVLTAAGMSAYASGNIEKAKLYLMHSSQVQPASAVCVQGLCALLALALLQSDQQVAVAAQAELAKVAIDTLDAKTACAVTWLNATYFFMLGDKETAHLQWSKALHRDSCSCQERLIKDCETTARAFNTCESCKSPHQSLLLATAVKWLLQTTGRSEQVPPMPPTAAIQDGALLEMKGMPEAGGLLAYGLDAQAAMRAAQKAVHANPANAHSWVALAASYAAVHHREPGKGWPAAQAAVGKVDAAAKNLQEQSHSSPVCLQAAKQSFLPLYCWTYQHWCWQRVLDLHLNSSAAVSFCQQNVKAMVAQPQAAAAMQLLALLVQWHVSQTSDRASLLGQLRLSVGQQASWNFAWQCLAGVYSDVGQLSCAELCYRQAVLVTAKSGVNTCVPLLRLALYSLQLFVAGNGENWLALAQEAVGESVKQNTKSVTALLLRAVVGYHAGDFKFARRQLQGLLPQLNSDAHSLARFYLARAHLSLDNYEPAKELVEQAEHCSDPLSRLAFEHLQSISSA